MDVAVLALFLLSTFFGGLTSGLAGFASGLVVSGVWLHLFTPMQTAVLIASYGIVNQSYAVWKLRRTFSWRRVAPYIGGSLIGVPLGAAMLAAVDPGTVRFGFGILLICYSSYSLLKPAFTPIHVRPVTEIGIGVLNGALGGLTGLGGVVITIWTQLRDLPKDIQRTIFQPVIAATMTMTTLTYALQGAFTAEVGAFFLLGLPALAAGIWSGFKLYGRLDDAAFRRIVLFLLLASGLTLVVPLTIFG